MIAPKYRTDSQACSCPRYWYRRTCRHYRAYAEAVALVLAQDAVNLAFPSIGDNLSPMDVLTIPANIAAMGVSPYTPTWRVWLSQTPIPAYYAPIGEGADSEGVSPQSPIQGQHGPYR